MNRVWLWWLIILCLDARAAPRRERPLLLRLPEKEVKVNLNQASELENLIALAEAQIQKSRDQEKRWHAERERQLAGGSLGTMQFKDLKRYYSEPHHFITEKDRRGWREIKRLASTALESGKTEVWQDCVWQMREVAAAIRNNHRSPSPPHMDILQPPLYYADYAYNPIGQGDRPAYNLRRGDTQDLSLLDPMPSTFWARPAVHELDLYHGFGRTNLPDFEKVTWAYAGPKLSYGGCPGFEAEHGDMHIKVKFGETTSEPFTARIFWALGYHVEATDYVHSLKLKYDRRLLREFHMRKDVAMKARALMIKIYTVNLQQRYDPFDYIHQAVLADGEVIAGAVLKERLFYNSRVDHPEDYPDNFNVPFEERIRFLITTPANVQVRDAATKSIGAWDFASLDHADRREVRAAGLAGAWVGWFDSRFENTRLKLVRHGGTNELRHFFTDLGGGLGQAKGVLSRHCECPNDFGWRFTRPPRPQGKGKMTIPFRIVDYQPIEDTEAFRQMTVDDARWMARLIGRLTEKQIVAALIAAGFDATETRIYTEKLVSRRDWMLKDLGLAGVVPLLRGEGGDTRLTYNPRTDPRPQVMLANSKTVDARPSPLRIEDGVVLPRTHTRSPQQRLESVED